MSKHSQSEAATLLREGIEAAQSGNRFIARMRLEKAAELEPANADCWIWLAWTSESPKSAIFALRHAMKCATTHSATRKGLSWVHSLCDFRVASSESDELPVLDDEDTKPFVYKFADLAERTSDSVRKDDAESERSRGLSICQVDGGGTVENLSREDGLVASNAVDKLDDRPTEKATVADGDASLVTDIVNRVNAIRDEFAHLRLDADRTSIGGETEAELSGSQ